MTANRQSGVSVIVVHGHRLGSFTEDNLHTVDQVAVGGNKGLLSFNLNNDGAFSW